MIKKTNIYCLTRKALKKLNNEELIYLIEGIRDCIVYDSEPNEIYVDNDEILNMASEFGIN